MCYHYSITKKQEEIMRMIQAEWETPFEPVFHTTGFNFPQMPVITVDAPGKIQLYNWGLIPHWVKTLADANKIRSQTLNAKAETIWEKPSFRTAVNNRCIVLADGFFEWMEFKKKKYPHYVHFTDFQIFGFAGLFSHWTDKETGELFRTFTILTTNANPLMERIHNMKKRMPVILQKKDWKNWLQPALTKDQMQQLLLPCNEAGMKAYPVSRLITTRGADTNVPDIKELYAYPELALTEQGSLFDA